jgi:SAM-dependent methyltransferase
VTEREFSQLRYLAAKRTVDDRALNRCVWEEFTRALLGPRPNPVLRLLEVGSGIGTMVERLLEWTDVTDCEYTALDRDRTSAGEAARRLAAWAHARGWQAAREADASWRIEGSGRSIRVRFETADLFGFLGLAGAQRSWDGVLAHAVLDLVDLERAVPVLLEAVAPGGWFYFTLNFDGTTVFLPASDPALDARVEDAYHASMDERRVAGRPTGGSRAGRRLYSVLASSGATVRAWGSSDWTVWPAAGKYSDDEAYFLGCVVGMVEHALGARGELALPDQARWIAARRAQLEAGELAFLAHQLDYFGFSGLPESRS